MSWDLRLGHKQVSTTENIYSHIIKEADARSSECIANMFLRRQPPSDREEKR